MGREEVRKRQGCSQATLGQHLLVLHDPVAALRALGGRGEGQGEAEWPDECWCLRPSETWKPGKESMGHWGGWSGSRQHPLGASRMEEPWNEPGGTWLDMLSSRHPKGS